MKSKKKEISIIRSSAAEYLTFITANGEGGVEAIYADENVWLTQKMMATLYNVTIPTINEHLKKIFSDSELQEDSVIRNFRITAGDGNGRLFICYFRIWRSFVSAIGDRRITLLNCAHDVYTIGYVG